MSAKFVSTFRRETPDGLPPASRAWRTSEDLYIISLNESTEAWSIKLGVKSICKQKLYLDGHCRLQKEMQAMHKTPVAYEEVAENWLGKERV